MIDSKKIKVDFPIFKNNPDLVYLDTTATSLKPKSVIRKLQEYYENYSANIFRGVYKISEIATREYEDSRQVVAGFINAGFDEIIFTRNTTESLNLIAYSLGREIADQDSEIVTTVMEHHSNFVPWQVLASENGAVFKVIDIDGFGRLKLPERMNLDSIITKKTKIFALTLVSNVLGTINPVKEIIKEVRRVNPETVIIVDAAQAVPHFPVDVKDLDCDFLAFSSHKMLGPTGVGVLWGKKHLLKTMFPFQYGGEMVDTVSLEKTTFKGTPHKFEAGTPAIAEVIALKEAVNYLKSLGWKNILSHERNLSRYFLKLVEENFSDEIKFYGPEGYLEKQSIFTFTFNNYHPHDVAQILDESGIAVRAGHHCAMPLHKRLGLTATTRASFYIYNTKVDVDRLIAGLKKVKKILN